MALGFVPPLACISDILLRVAATEQILIRISPKELGDIDRLRKDEPRTTWIKARLREVVAAHDGMRALSHSGASVRRVAVGGAEAEGVSYVPGREGGAPISRAGRTLAEMSGKGAFPKASRGKR